MIIWPDFKFGPVNLITIGPSLLYNKRNNMKTAIELKEICDRLERGRKEAWASVRAKAPLGGPLDGELCIAASEASRLSYKAYNTWRDAARKEAAE